MFTFSDLVQAFRDEFWPVAGENPALTRRTLRRCVQHPGTLADGGRPLIILAEIRMATESGRSIGSHHLYADPGSIQRHGLETEIRIGARFPNGRIDWQRVSFHDHVGRFNLGRFVHGLEGYAITLRPYEGTQTFGVNVPDEAHGDVGLADEPASSAAEAAPAQTALARAEQHITTALAEADSVARSALRRHLAKVAHPDTVSVEDRSAYDAALGRAFGAIDRGRFAFEP